MTTKEPPTSGDTTTTVSEDPKPSEDETKANSKEEDNDVTKKESGVETPSAPSDGVVAQDEEDKSHNNSEAIDPTTVEAVAERLKFFFSNANIRKDNFMRKILLQQKNAVPIETLLKFNSIKTHTTNPSVIVQAAQSLSDFLVVSDDQKIIGRVEPFVEAQMDEHIPLTLFLKDVPHQDGNYLVTVQEIRDFFREFGNVAIVKLGFHASKHKGRKPKGTCMVEFEDVASVEKATASVLTSKDGEAVTPERPFVVGELAIQVLTLEDHMKQSKAKEDEDAQGDDEGENHDDNAKDEVTIDWKKGCVIKLDGLSKDCDREAIMEEVAKFLDVTVEEVKGKIYVDFSRGQTDGAIRFQEPSDSVADLCQKLANGEIQIAGAKVEAAKVLEGEEEFSYWQRFLEFKKKQRRHRADEHSGRKNKRRRRN